MQKPKSNMNAQIFHFHEGIPQCQPHSYDQQLLVPTLHRTDMCRQNKKLSPLRQSGMEVSDILQAIHQENRGKYRRKQPYIKTSSTVTHRNRVRFEVDANNEIIPHIQNPNEELVLTEEEIKAMWWCNEENMYFRRCAKRDSHAYQAADSTDSSYTTRFKEALEVCRKSSGHLKNIPLVSNTAVRGLEMYIFPEALFKQRQRVIHSVLELQAKIPASMESDHKARLLNAVSKALTRPYRRLSRLLAIGDAWVVTTLDQKDYHEDDFHSQL